jgi:ribonuclease E
VRSVASVALQLLRSVEETLMKGATHNLIVRTRTEVALYVLNHKRGHLRDLENGFKVSISISADATQQSFVIDHGEQVHTLEAAKALLAAQASTTKRPIAEAEDDEDDFIDDDGETMEGEDAVAEGAGLAGETSEGDGEGRRRRRRRRRRGGRGGEPREQVTADEPTAPLLAPDEGDEGDLAGEVEETAAFDGERADGERSDEGGGRRRRRGRRGGRRRRGGHEQEEGSVAAIADDLGQAPQPEVAVAVADLDQEQPPTRHIEIATPETAPAETPQPEPAEPVAQAAEAASETADTKRRRSTVREKVSFGLPAAESPAPVPQQQEPAPATAEPEASRAPEPAPEAEQPRRAGWWSRRFGGG